MERKHGIAYEFCGANPLKLMLFKSVWHAFLLAGQMGGASRARVVDNAILANLDIGRRRVLLRC